MAKLPVGNFLPDLRARATGSRSRSKCSDTQPSWPESPGMVAGLRCVQELSAARGLFLELLPSWVLASAAHIGVVMDQRAVVSGVKEDEGRYSFYTSPGGRSASSCPGTSAPEPSSYSQRRWQSFHPGGKTGNQMCVGQRCLQL